jgi:two-component system LytT family response regulator
MIKAVLIDDETHCLDTLGMLIGEYCPDVQIVDRCKSANAGLEAIEKLKPDVVFLDIQMPGTTGFQLLEQIPEINFAIVFTTSFDQFAIKAIHFSALDYLLKPVAAKDLIAAVHRVKERKKLPSPEQFEILQSTYQHKASAIQKLAIPIQEGFELINIDQIISLEADDNYTQLFLKDKVKIIASRTLKEVEEQLREFPNFVRVHHSYMVNINEVTRYVRGEGGYLIMSDGSSINVSRSRKEALLKFF